MSRPLVLLSNDDGYQAAGIHLLREALLRWADVVLCCPDREQSATSHSLTLTRPLRIREHAPGCYSVDGTPADSVYVGLHAERLLPRAPDLVVSGMNHGLNLGLDAFYSGTVAAAREGALSGHVALAVSADLRADQRAAAERGSAIAEALHRLWPQGSRLFNVNIPPGGSWKVRATRLGRRVYEGGLVERLDPRGEPYYWVGGKEVRHVPSSGTDTEAYDEGVVGITPLVLDLWSSHLEGDAELLAAQLG